MVGLIGLRIGLSVGLRVGLSIRSYPDSTKKWSEGGYGALLLSLIKKKKKKNRSCISRTERIFVESGEHGVLRPILSHILRPI